MGGVKLLLRRLRVSPLHQRSSSVSISLRLVASLESKGIRFYLWKRYRGEVVGLGTVLCVQTTY